MKPFRPHALPPTNIDYGDLVGLVGKANAAVARYDGALQNVINPSILLSPLTTQEAVLSSKIEGTQATLDEVLEHDADESRHEEKKDDIQEIVNYRTALSLAGQTPVAQPLSLSLLQQLHAILMGSVRGQDKSPGEFRSDQNWLGSPGCTIEQATFVPPSPLQLLDHLEVWVAYAISDAVDPLIQAAIVHAQFEIIHPFKDGNGRIGRLLIPLLYKKAVLGTPTFYLSDYLEGHREVYYALLNRVSAEDDWQSWIRFFLIAVTEQAKTNLDKVRQTIALYEEMKSLIPEATRSRHAITLLDAIFDRPVFQTSEMASRTGLPKQSVIPLLRKMREAHILTTIRESSGRRAAILAFPRLVNITEGRTVVALA